MRGLLVALACLAPPLAIPRRSVAASTVQYAAEARWYSTAPDDRSKLLTAAPSYRRRSSMRGLLLTHVLAIGFWSGVVAVEIVLERSRCGSPANA